MNLQGNITSILSVLSILLSVAGLVIAPATAAGAAQPSVTGGAGFAGFGTHHGAINATAQTERLQSMLTKLGQSGVDISQPQADLTGGNTTAAKQWLSAYYKDHPGVMGNRTRAFGNSTAITERVQTMLTKLGQNGVDISQPQADLTAGNTTAAMQWLLSYHKAHQNSMGTVPWPKFGNSTARAEMLQSALTKLGQSGVDVSQPQADLAAGNATAAMQWLFTYHKDHQTSTGTSDRSMFGNTTAWKGMNGKGLPHRFWGHASGNMTWPAYPPSGQTGST